MAGPTSPPSRPRPVPVPPRHNLTWAEPATLDQVLDLIDQIEEAIAQVRSLAQSLKAGPRE